MRSKINKQNPLAAEPHSLPIAEGLPRAVLSVTTARGTTSPASGQRENLIVTGETEDGA